MQRRRVLAHLGLATSIAAGLVRAAGAVVPALAAVPGERVRIGLTPVFLDDQVGFLNDWRDYIETQLKRPVEFVQRGSYRQIVDLVREGKIQFAWICGYPFVRNQATIRLLAVPVHRGQPLYQSYLIVPEKDTVTRSMFDLRNRVFAYSDPDSNSGFLYPQYRLTAAGERPATFFRRSFFTYSHRNVVVAVAAHVAHGGAVDGYVWETLGLSHPQLTGQTRIVDRSPYFGFPPLVASPAVRVSDVKAMQDVLLTMHESIAGKALLRRLDLDRFDAGSLQLFDGIERMARVVNGA